MKDKDKTKPDEVLDSIDVGDEVALRYRYQHTYAAICSLRLVDHTSDTILCENHEDFIIKHADGSFTAVQVKTRDLSGDPLKANDAQVVKALQKFCKLDKNFPGDFRSFDFSTNFDFWTQKDDHKNLPALVEKCQRREKIDRLRKDNPLRIFATSIVKGSDLSLNDVCSTMKKVHLNARRETVASIKAALIDEVGQSEFAEDYTYQKTVLFADRLTSLAYLASSKGIKGSRESAYVPGSSFDAAIRQLLLDGKSITYNDTQNLVNEFSQPVLAPLQIDGLLPVDDLPKDLAVMIQKLAFGEMQKVRIDHLSDLVRSFQHLQASWARKYSPEKAKLLTESVLAHVLHDCVEAEASVSDETQPFAREKYDFLKVSLNERLKTHPTTVPECTVEHLIGAAGILTEQCKVWWSPKFEFRVQNDV